MIETDPSSKGFPPPSTCCAHPKETWIAWKETRPTTHHHRHHRYYGCPYEDGRVAVADNVVEVAVVVVTRVAVVVRLRSRDDIPPGVVEGEEEGDEEENPTKRPRGDAAVGEVDVMVGGIDD